MSLFFKAFGCCFFALAGVICIGSFQEPPPNWKGVRLSKLPDNWMEEDASSFTGTWIDVTREVVFNVNPAEMPRDDFSKLNFEDFGELNPCKILPLYEKEAVFVRGTKKGVMYVATVTWVEQNRAFAIQNAQIIVAKIGQCRILCLKVDGKEEYHWLKYRFKKNDDVEIYFPNPIYIESLVAEKKLAGKISEVNRTVVVSPTGLADLFQDESQLSKCFLETPVVYRTQER